VTWSWRETALCIILGYLLAVTWFDPPLPTYRATVIFVVSLVTALMVFAVVYLTARAAGAYVEERRRQARAQETDRG
jgi:hypothetical protein